MCRDGRIGRPTQSGVLAKTAGRSTKTNDAASKDDSRQL